MIYSSLNVVAVRYYGEAEFWLSIGKVLLIMIVFGFTLVTMCGGNPQRNAYGFTNWNNPVIMTLVTYATIADVSRVHSRNICRLGALENSKVSFRLFGEVPSQL